MRYGEASRARTDRRGRGSWLNQVPQIGEAAVADAIDLTQLVHRAETAVLGAVVDDVLGQHRAHAGQGVELVRGGRVEETGAVGAAAPATEPTAPAVFAPPAPGTAAGAGPPTTICSPSTRNRARLSPSVFVPGRTPPAARNASVTREPAGSR